MEIKLRRKGEVVTVDGFPENSIPKAITPTEGLEGIDLTAYSVIYAGFGRHGGDKARELHSRAPGAIVVYKYEWRNGWGEGVLLPEPFNPSRVRFYKSATQVKAEAEEAKKKAAEALREEVSKAISDVRVYVGYNQDGERYRRSRRPSPMDGGSTPSRSTRRRPASRRCDRCGRSGTTACWRFSSAAVSRTPATATSSWCSADLTRPTAPTSASRSASTRRTIAVRTRRGGSSSRRRTVSGWRAAILPVARPTTSTPTSKSRKHSTEFREVLTKNFPLFLGCVSELMSPKDENKCTLIKDKKAHWLTS